MDYISERVLEERPNSALSYLLSPSTVHHSSDTCFADAARRRAASPAWHAPLSWTGALRPPAIVAGCLLDGISVFQGPNYCLAKSLQEWRAIATRHRGAIVSANVASAARTESVVSSTSAAAALEGMQALFPSIIYAKITSMSKNINIPI